MDAILQIVVTGLTLGSVYALASVGLALIYGTMGMFNLAHGLFMTIGAYAAYAASALWGAPLYVGLLAGLIAGGLSGLLLYVFVVHFMLDTEDFQMTVMVATAGVAILLQDLILKRYGAYPFKQPVQTGGFFKLGSIAVTYQAVLILVVAAIMIGGMVWLLTRTRFGLAIRATAMNSDAAQLMGVHTRRTYLQVLIISGVLAGVAGVLISSLAGLSPDMGSTPLIRAFIICVVAGLGSVGGAGISAIILGLLEAGIGYYFGVRYGLPVMLGLVVLVLIFRPAGIFGRQEVMRS